MSCFGNGAQRISRNVRGFGKSYLIPETTSEQAIKKKLEHRVDSEKMMTQKEVMHFLQISRTTLHRLRKEGVIPTYKVGKQGVRFKRSEIEEYVNQQKQGA